ncbi:glutamine synthetase [Penicillium sp. IBT 31633x]|nr:glutamine synthetase [Penicillium sp. IBT 31633x]
MATGVPSNSTDILCQFRRRYTEVNFLRFQWQDYSGVLRGRVMPIDTAMAQIAKGGPLKATGLAMCVSVTNNLLPSTPLDGQYWLVPDWSTLHPTVSPKSAQVMCALDYTVPATGPVSREVCPRHVLQKILRRAREDFGLDFLVGFEVEFVVMKANTCTGKMERCSQGWGLFSVAGLRDQTYQYVEECVSLLEALGVDFQAIHTEGQRGQYEFALGPRSPLEAVDQLVLVHSYLKDVFARHGYTVTMVPKPVATESLANGQHMHISLQPASPELEESFLAGILKRLPALCSFCLPQDVSYERLVPFVAGGNTACWGTETRFVPIRKIEPSRWEIRNIDAMANMYSAMAGIIGAGLCGLAGQEPLVWPDLGDPANKDASRGEPLPKNVEEAIGLLDADTFGLADMLGRPIINHYVDMKRFELSKLNRLGSETAAELFIELF